MDNSANRLIYEQISRETGISYPVIKECIEHFFETAHTNIRKGDLQGLRLQHIGALMPNLRHLQRIQERGGND